jgi:hypothetical protein
MYVYVYRDSTTNLTRDFVDELQHSDDSVVGLDGHAQYRLRAVA